MKSPSSKLVLCCSGSGGGGRAASVVGGSLVLTGLGDLPRDEELLRILNICIGSYDWSTTGGGVTACVVMISGGGR